MKQVIVMRTDLNMRKGKMIAQGAHAAMMCMMKSVYEGIRWADLELIDWLEHGMKKICVRTDTEEQLLELHRKAKEAGLRAHMVTDAGHTEFHGVPTVTCLAIGPNEDGAVDAITGGLTLL